MIELGPAEYKVLTLWALYALIPAFIAKKKRRNPFIWYVIGFIIPPSIIAICNLDYNYTDEEWAVERERRIKLKAERDAAERNALEAEKQK